MSEDVVAPVWVPVGERLPEKSGIYPAMSTHKMRKPPRDWEDALCSYNADAPQDQVAWQHSSGFYDGAITHRLDLQGHPQ